MTDNNKYSKIRKLKYGINAFILTISMIGIIFIINAIIAQNSMQYDLTKNKSFSLTSQTLKVLENLDKQVVIFIFSKEGDLKNEMLIDLLNQYTRKSKFVKARIVDLDKNPSLAEKFKVTQLGTIVFACGDSNAQIKQTDLYDFGIGMEGHGKTSKFNGEQVITSNIMRVVSGEKKTVYFLVGHGERLVSNMEEAGLSNLQDCLIKENYEVNSINISKNPDIPVKDTVLILPGPKYFILDREIKAIEEYLEKGGKVFIMIDPKVAASNGLNKLLAKWGIDLNEDIVIEPGSSYFFDPLTPIPLYVPHVITDELIRAKTHAVFPGARTVLKSEKTPEALEIIPLLRTSSKSWAERNLKDQEAEFDANDMKGPLTLAVAVEKKIKNIKDSDTTGAESTMVKEKTWEPILIAVGDSDFASNRMSASRGNIDFLINSINWLAGDSEKISIRPILMEYSKIDLNKNQSKIVLVISLALVPLLIAGIGGVIWWKRRGL